MQPIATSVEQTSLPVNSSHDKSIPHQYKELSKYHQRTPSTAMGPMGTNENHGPQSAKLPQESSPHKHDTMGNASPSPHQSRVKHRKNATDQDEDEQDELDEDENMDPVDLTDEENVDELMDEEGESNGSESYHSQGYYSRPDSQHQQQYPPHGFRSLQNILPRPGAGLPQPEQVPYGHDGMSHDRGGSDVWDPLTKDLPRQGAPRNNRPLQVRTTDNNDMNGAINLDYNNNGSNGSNNNSSNNNSSNNNGSNNNGNNINGNSNGNANNSISNNVNSTKNGTSAGHGSEIAITGSTTGVTSANGTSVVNNGSSKKRTTPAKHKCPQCDKYFTRPFNLKSHQRTHTQERPFVCSFAHCCPECHRNFVRQDALTRHLRLDFGHNRCSGYPGPIPGGSSNQEKSEESGDDTMGDSPTDVSHYPAPKNAEGSSIPVQAGPLYKSPSSPTSPTLASPTGKARPRSEKIDNDPERSSTSALVGRDSRMGSKSAPNPDLTEIAQEPREDGDQGLRRDIGSQSRHSSSNVAPISFVHRSSPVERKALTPPNSNERSAFLSQHSRTYSQSTFNQGPPPAPSSTSNGMAPQSSGTGSSNDFSSGERRISPTNARNGTWPTQGHDPSNAPIDYHHQNHQNLPTARQLPPPHVLTRPDVPKPAPYGSEFDRMRSYPHPLPEHPPSPQEARRASPPNHPSEWSAPGQDNARPWSWDSRQQQETRHRHPSWSSAPSPTSRGPPPPQSPHDQMPQSPSVPLPRGQNMNSWPRGSLPPSLVREETAPRDSREGPIRMPPRPPSSSYPSSPYPAEPSIENHPRPPSSTSQAMARPMEPYRRPDLERDPRQRSMSEIDRIRGPSMAWNEQRSRSFHELDAGMDVRSRFESHPHSPQHIRESISSSRSSTTVEASPSILERPQVYNGMVGAERYSQAKSYHERDLSREAGPGSVKSPVTKDPMPREYRPTRSYSTLEYESDRDAYHRQSRYSGDPKPSLREARRSMSPITSERYSNTEGRVFDGGPRYPYPGDRLEQYNREEAEKMSARQFRHDERAMVMSPLPRDDQAGFFGEPGRPNSYRASQGYPQSQQRFQEPPHRHMDEQHDPVRRERHSIDMPLASPSAIVGPPVAKRPLSATTVATR
ncbi:hypothetical protein BGX20_003478 [Mortierella sp. AD010]|nr:hypothetical protein BGX20_003478 [Mortierella sp. AD010]